MCIDNSTAKLAYPFPKRQRVDGQAVARVGLDAIDYLTEALSHGPCPIAQLSASFAVLNGNKGSACQKLANPIGAWRRRRVALGA